MQTGKMAGSVMLWWSGAAVLSLLVANRSPAEEKEEKKPEHPIVMRISSDVLNNLVDSKEVERHVGVQDNIMGTSVFGTAQVHGKPSIKLESSPDKAKFWITLKGTVNSTTTGYNGPAIIYSRSITNFSATRLVTFEPGKGFSGAPAQVAASTRTIVDGIDSTRGGLIGRIVRRRASRIEAGQHDMVQEIVRQRIANRLRNSFHQQSDQRLAKMNEAVELRKTAQAGGLPLLGKDVNWFCSTTPRYMQFATQSGSGAPLDLPLYSPENPQSAPIEIWMHNSLVGPHLAAGLEMLKLSAENTKLGMTVAMALQLLNVNSEDKIPTLLAERPIKLHTVDEWRVAKLEMPAKEVAQVVQLFRPELAPGGTAVKPTAPKPSTVAVQPKPTSRQPGYQQPQPEYAQRQPAHTQRQTVLKPVAVVARPKITHNKPSAEARTWTSGKYTAEARFVSLDGDTVRLERTSGVNTKIRFDKLSDADQSWIRQYVSTPPQTAGISPANQD